MDNIYNIRKNLRTIQVNIREARTSLLNAQTIAEARESIGEIQKKLNTVLCTDEYKKKEIGSNLSQLQSEMKEAETKWGWLGITDQRIRATRTKIEVATIEYELAYDSVGKAQRKVSDLTDKLNKKYNDSLLITKLPDVWVNIQAVERELLTTLESIGEIITDLQEARISMQGIQDRGQPAIRIIMSLVLGIALAVFGAYELLMIKWNFLFDAVTLLFFVAAVFSSYVITTYLVKNIPLHQGIKYKYSLWLCCFILLALVGLALFYKIPYDLGYQSAWPQFLWLIASILLIVAAPLVTFFVLYSGKILFRQK